MRRTTRTGLALMALAVSAAGAARPARAGTFYTLTDLGTLGGAPGDSSGQAVPQGADRSQGASKTTTPPTPRVGWS
jgi:hypothetical protein